MLHCKCYLHSFFFKLLFLTAPWNHQWLVEGLMHIIKRANNQPYQSTTNLVCTSLSRPDATKLNNIQTAHGISGQIPSIICTEELTVVPQKPLSQRCNLPVMFPVQWVGVPVSWIPLSAPFSAWQFCQFMLGTRSPQYKLFLYKIWMLLPHPNFSCGIW